MNLVKRLFSEPRTIAGFTIVALTCIAAVSAPFLYPQGPWVMSSDILVWPGESPAHLLGTDMLGRDVMAGIVHGARVSLVVGVTAAASALVIGALVGAFAGYHGGITDVILMRITEVFQTIPPIVLAIVIVAVFTPSIQIVIVAIAAISWPTIARLARGEFMSLRNRDFVHASIIIGMRPTRIIFTQILQNAMPPIIVTTSVMVAYAVLVESALGFLGLNDPNVMSWGTMIGAGRGMLRSAWYLTVIPGVAIALVVLALNLIAEGLNDTLNPQLKEQD